MNEMPSRAANASSLVMLASPTPRFGTLSTRLTLTSSTGLTTARRYAIASLTSRRS